MQPNEEKLTKLAREVEQQVDELDRAVREAVNAAVDEGRDLARHLAPIPPAERFDWLQRNWPGTRRLATLLLNLAKNPPPPDEDIAELVPLALVLFTEGNK